MVDKGKIAMDFLDHVIRGNFMARWLPPLMAFCLSFIIILGLAPALGFQIDRQIDFWILWIGSMVILALPLVYLEIALVKRSKTSALNALSALTREADASQRWRIAGWLSTIFMPFLAGGILFNITQMTIHSAQLNIQTSIIFAVGAVIAFALSFLNRQILVLLTAVGVIISFIIANVMGTSLQAWHVTPVESGEWGKATILALVASGLGLGIYGQSQIAQVAASDRVTGSVLPVWFAQLLAVVAFGFFAVSSAIPAYGALVAAILSAALLLSLAKEQFTQRSIALPIQFIVLLVALLIWGIPQLANIFNPLLMIWGLVICLIYSIFVGWIMKISHLRKALNFSNEMFYKIWRIAVRIVLPLSIVMALVAYIGQLI